MLEKELITVEILAEMTHEDLKSVGVHPYGHRHILLNAAKQTLSGTFFHLVF